MAWWWTALLSPLLQPADGRSHLPTRTLWRPPVNDRRAQAQVEYRRLIELYSAADTETWDRQYRIWAAKWPEFRPDANGCCGNIGEVDA